LETPEELPSEFEFSAVKRKSSKWPLEERVSCCASSRISALTSLKNKR